MIVAPVSRFRFGGGAITRAAFGGAATERGIDMGKKKKTRKGKTAPGMVYRASLSRARTTLRKLKASLFKDLHIVGGDPRSTKAHREKMFSVYLIVLGAERGLDQK